MSRVRVLAVRHLGEPGSDEIVRLAAAGAGASAAAIVPDSALAAELSESLALLPDWPGTVWLLTSGTTAASRRWVALSGQALDCSAQAVNEFLDAQGSRDTWVHALPLYHVGGLGILRRARLAGARVVPGIEPRSGRWDPAYFAAAADAHAATLSALVPAQVHDLMVRELRPPGSLRAVVVGGGRLDPALARRARRLGWPVLGSYGMTETASQVATQPLSDAANVDAASGPRLRVLAHAEIDVGRDGCLRVRAGSLLTAYAHVVAHGAGARVRIEDPRDAADGAFPTGDFGDVPSPGWVRVAGRSGDRVKVLGETVDLEELEGRVRGWLGEAGLDAADFALVAVPDERSGYVIRGVYRGDAEFADRAAAVLDAHAGTGELRGFERVRAWTSLDEIPRTDLGKVRRRELERRLAGEVPNSGGRSAGE